MMDSSSNVRIKSEGKFLPIFLFAVLASTVFGGWYVSRVEVEDTLFGKACVPIPGVISTHTIVLRVDDVQAYAWRDTTEMMMTDAESRDIPLVLGIIPIGLTGDTELTEFLVAHECKHEFALHGWDHNSGPDGTEPEFGNLTKDEATLRITPGLAMLKAITAAPIVTWIPPMNVESEGTIKALTELGFKYFSVEGSGRFDYDAATYDFVTKTLISPEKIVARCEEEFQRTNVCIIMLHPQDFADGLEHDAEKYTTYYLALIDALKARRYTFARFKDIPL